MQSLIYQRTIIGYHGCDRALVEDVLLGRKCLKASHNNYDWLGEGIYFWEYGCQRALDWAEGISKRRPKMVKEPAAIGAHIHLGVCFDLLDVRFTAMVADLYPLFEITLKKQGAAIPQNEPAHGTDRDLVPRKLDCAMLLMRRWDARPSRSAPVLGRSNERMPKGLGKPVRLGAIRRCCARGRARAAVAYPAALAVYAS